MLNGRLIKIYSSLVGWSVLAFPVRLYLLLFGAPAFGKRIRYGQIRKILGYEALNGRRVLDVGGAPGDLLFFLADRYAIKEGVCADRDRKRLAAAFEMSGYAVYRNLRFTVADVYEFFENTGYDGYFDVVFCLDVLEHVEDDEGLLAYIHSSLKDKGIVVIASPSRRRKINPEDEKIHGHMRPGYERDEMSDLLAGSGFTVEYFQYRDRLDLAYWYYRLKPDILMPIFFPAVYSLSVMFDLFAGHPAGGSRIFAVGRKTTGRD